jgi:hypothetical protein
MSGRKIDDHAFFGGAKSKGSVFPEGVKIKDESSAGGYGSESFKEYPDTTEMLKRDQEMAISKMKAHPMKSGYRN